MSTTSRSHHPKFFYLNRLIWVIAYCRGFIINCRSSKANRQSTTLSTQTLDQALSCCVKMVQQVSYAQEMKKLEEKKLHSTVPSTNWKLSWIMNVLSVLAEDYYISLFLIKQIIRFFYLQIITVKPNCWDTGLSLFQSLVRLIQWSFEPNI